MPGTALSDQYGATTISDTLASIAEQDPPIEVVGITDYLTTGNFRETHAIWAADPDSTINELFVNVELRLLIKTRKDVAVNLHLMCAADQVDELDRFLRGLEFHSLKDRFRAERDDLIRLGRAHKDDPELQEPAALREGVNQFKVEFKDLKELYDTTPWARDHLLIAVPGGEGDGPAGLRDDSGAFTLLRRELERFAHIIFSGNPKQKAFWLGHGPDGPDALVHHYGGKKLCFHGSDGHDLDSAGIPDLNRYAWLKGDPTFETLRQACIAPDFRGHVGSEPPTDRAAHGRITTISVDAASWFPNQTVPLNTGLVAIIGARGSGKTAIADLIAAAAGSSDLYQNDESFVHRAGDLLGDATATATWTEGDDTSAELVSPDAGEQPRVRYLSQQFVDHLCESEGVTDELLAEIRRVVFNAWPAGERLGATTFKELLAARLGAARSTQQAETAAIADLSERVTTQRLLIESLPNLERELAQHEAQKLELEKQAQALTAKADRANAARLAAVSAAFDQRSREKQEVARRVKALEGLANDIYLARTTKFPTMLARLVEDHAAATISKEDWSSVFTIDFGSNVDTYIAAAERAATAELDAISGTRPADTPLEALDHVTVEDLGTIDVGHLTAERERLKHLVGLDDARTAQLTALTEKISDQVAKISKIQEKIVDANGASGRRDALIAERLERYASYFDALLEEEEELTALYAPLGRIIANAGPTVARLEFSVQRVVDVDGWAEIGESFLDLRTGGPFRGRGGLAAVARDELYEAWRAGDGTAAAAAIRSFSKDHSTTMRKHRNKDDRRTPQQWQRAVNEWMYAADHVTLTYSLKHDGLDIKSLSRGTRGIVLLLLYLAIDEEETVPLIIDQPEENLDPASVQSDLVGLFQKASTRRQIIMVTHNANLVVNTDVDQVIVAKRGPLEPDELPEFTYLSGGLENAEIRACVCDVLEGGAAAFRERARRLRINDAI